MQNKRLLFLCLLFISCFLVKSKAQFYSVGIDFVGAAFGSFNAEASIALDRHWTLHLGGAYNPWTYSDNVKFKSITAHSGARYWLRETYGHSWFIGAHVLVSRFNWGGGLGINRRYDGNFSGGGFSAGFALPVAKRFNLEFELGGAIGYGSYTKNRCERCGDLISENKGLTFIPSRTAVSFVFLF